MASTIFIYRKVQHEKKGGKRDNKNIWINYFSFLSTLENIANTNFVKGVYVLNRIKSQKNILYAGVVLIKKIPIFNFWLILIWYTSI